jgi:hypothetical protein
MRDFVRIVTAHDGTRQYGVMAGIAQRYAEAVGYEYIIEEDSDIKHKKPALIAKYLTKEWATWMDADSILMRPIDEVFEINFDVAIACQEREPRNTKRYGAYLYSGLIVAHNTPRTKQFLTDWGGAQVHTSDQRNLNAMLEGYLDSTIYERTGEVLNCGGLRILILDPDVYVHQKALHEMRLPDAYVKIIHFKGRLHRDCWPRYRRLLC